MSDPAHELRKQYPVILIRFLQSIPFHPPLFSVFPVVFLLSTNIDQVVIGEAARSFIAFLAAALLVWAILGLVIRSVARAAVIVFLLMVLLFTYPLYSVWFVQTVAVVLMFLGLFVFIGMSRRNWQPVTFFLNIASMAVMAFPSFNIAYHLVTPSSSVMTEANAYQEPPDVEGFAGSKPDIYYIILDGYAREDVLRQFYGYDNAPFLDFLRRHGFYIADQARANYSRTNLSLASSLNFTYLQKFVENNNLVKSRDMKPLRVAIYGNRVMAFLKRFGYTTYAYGSGIFRTNFTGADKFFKSKTILNDFENTLLGNTPIHRLMYKFALGSPYDRHRESLLATLEDLAEAPAFPSPKFVFAHFICPHPPFVFTADGSPAHPANPNYAFTDGNTAIGPFLTQEEYRQGYREQLHYLNTRLMKTIDRLLQDDPDAIVIIQSDHGPGMTLDWESAEKTNMKERLSILNAIRFPDDGRGLPYPTMSPVNTFRLIFNGYLGAEFKPLPDTSYFCVAGSPYFFIEILLMNPELPTIHASRAE
ncbi:sulfatase-like hydrolase/transferase [Candidatus Hydrogenedentota bacterium]